MKIKNEPPTIQDQELLFGENFIPSNFYSCQQCGKNFESEGYEEKNLIYMLKLLKLPQKQRETKQNACYKLSQYYCKKLLSSIKREAQGSGSNI